MSKLKSHEPMLSVNDGVIDTDFHFEKIDKSKVKKDAYVYDIRARKDISSREIKSSMDHGSSVMGLMTDPDFGVSPVAKYSLIAQTPFDSSMIKSLDKAFETNTKIVNISLACGNSESNRALAKAAKDGLIIVTSSGNGFDDGESQIERCKRDKNLIVVGSVSPEGYVSSFSQQGQNVTILAPSNYEVQTKIGDRQVTFGGTSGASPQVKGAIDNVLALLPKANTENIKELLKKTATKLFSEVTEDHPKYHNGYGMINAYKLARVAYKIRNEKKKNPNKSLKELIESPQMYDFKDEATGFLNQGRSLYLSDKCEDKQLGLELIRKSFLLNQTESARKALIKIYDKDDKYQMKNFYESLNPDHLKFSQEVDYGIYMKHMEHYPVKK